jgi:hypothetical protein
MQRLQIGRRLAANAGTATVPALRKGKSRAAQKRSEIIFLFLPPNVTHGDLYGGHAKGDYPQIFQTTATDHNMVGSQSSNGNSQRCVQYGSKMS